jgi:hypothetical protein
MSDYDIHSCGYYCDHPACIKRQRDELRDKLFSDQAVKTYSGGKPNYTQPIEQEPVDWMKECADFWEHYTYITEAAQEKYNVEAEMWLKKLRTAPPKKEWVGLTDDEIAQLMFKCDVIVTGPTQFDFAQAIEAKLKEKNT